MQIAPPPPSLPAVPLPQDVAARTPQVLAQTSAPQMVGRAVAQSSRSEGEGKTRSNQDRVKGGDRAPGDATRGGAVNVKV